MTDRVVNRIVNNELQSVVHRLAVHHRGIVAVKTCCIEEGLLTVPLINPAIRQIIRADDNGRVNQRMHDDTYVCDAVATGRCQSFERCQSVVAIGFAEYFYRLTFHDVTLNVVVVRLVHREV